MKRFLAILLVIAFVLAGTTNAAVKQGDSEFSIFGLYGNTKYEDGDSADSATLLLGIGHFYTNEIELGASLIGGWTEDRDVFSIGGNAKYHFMTENTTVPYVGGQLNYAQESNSGSTDGMIWGPLVGVKFFVNEKTAVGLEYQYRIYEGDYSDYVKNEQGVFLGISFLF
jgi:hypothetical protein